MTTIGLRGVLACAFITSSSLLTGMVALPSGAAASVPFEANVAVSPPAGPGLFQQIKRKACQVSLAATHNDRRGSLDRTRECGH
jgi:hypothetical protein